MNKDQTKWQASADQCKASLRDSVDELRALAVQLNSSAPKTEPPPGSTVVVCLCPRAFAFVLAAVNSALLVAMEGDA